MAVAVGTTSTLALGSRTNSTVTAPASIANGDLLLCILVAGATAGSAPAVTGPTGFTKVTGSPFTMTDAVATYRSGLNVFWKIAASESGSYVFTHSAADSQAIMYRITGAHQTTPLNPTMTSNTNNGNSPANVGKLATALSITTAANSSLVLYAVSLWDGGPGTVPTGSTPTFTERLDTGALYVADGVLATAGATGNKVNASNFTAQTTSSPWYALLIAVQPPAAGAFTLTAAAGSYAVTGTAATLTLNTPHKVVTASAGSYAMTGTAATLTKAGGAGSLPVFRAEAHTSYASRSTQTDVSKPTGTVDGDIMVATFLAAGNPATDLVIDTVPSGWTQIGTTTTVDQLDNNFHGKLFVYWKRASSEGSTYSFLHNNTFSTQAIIASYSGCIATGSPVDVFSQNSATGAGSSTATGTGVTTTVANTKLIYTGHNWDGSATLTPPTGMTERLDGVAYYADEDVTAAGATGNRTQTLASTNPWQAYLVALKPAGATGFTLTAAAGAYAVTGTAQALKKTWITTGLVATYIYTGTTALTTLRGVVTSRTFSIGGKLGLTYISETGSRQYSSPGGYIAETATGTAYRVTAGTGSYILSGSTVTLNRSGNKSVTASPGAYNITGTTVTSGRGLISLSGAYNLTGQAAAFVRAVRVLSAEAGAYDLTGSLAFLLKSGEPVPWGWLPSLAGSGSLSHHDMMLTADSPPNPVGTTSVTLWDSGRHYVETTFVNAAPSGFYGVYDEATDTGTLIELESGDVVLRPADTVIPTFAPIEGGDVVGLAYDGDTGTVWFRVNRGPWNNDRAQAPDSTGIGLWEIPTDVGCSGALTPYVGDYRIFGDGTVLENYDFPFQISFRANNITIRNCRVISSEIAAIAADPYTGAMIDHCTIIGSLVGDSAIFLGGDSTVRNCDISGFENGIAFSGDNIVIENNYIHDLGGPDNPDDPPHVDGMQTSGFVYNLTIDNNWIESWDTSCIFLKCDAGPIDTVLIENNTLINMAGQFTAAPIYTTSMGTNLATNIRINRNRLQAGVTGLYLNYQSATPECFYNIDYDTSEPVLLFFQGFPVVGLALTVELGQQDVPPVEPVGVGMTLRGNWIGLGGDVAVATPTMRSHNLSSYSYVADAHVAPPTGVQENDILVVAMFRGKANEEMLEPVLFTPGWTQLGDTQTFNFIEFRGQFTVWWRRATSSEPSEHLWGFWEESNTQTWIGAYQNCTLAGAIDAFSQNSGTDVTATATGVATTQKTDVLLWLGSNWDGSGSLAPPAGMTERADAVVYVAEQTLTTHGATGTRTQTQASSGVPWNAMLVSLRGA